MRRWRATRTPGLLKRPNSLLVIDTGQLRHRLHRDVDFPAFLAFLRLFDCRQILTNGILNIFESLFLGLSLRPAPWKAWAGDAEPFLATLDCDFLPHDSILPLANSMNSRQPRTVAPCHTLATPPSLSRNPETTAATSKAKPDTMNMVRIV